MTKIRQGATVSILLLLLCIVVLSLESYSIIIRDLAQVTFLLATLSI